MERRANDLVAMALLVVASIGLVACGQNEPAVVGGIIVAVDSPDAPQQPGMSLLVTDGSGRLRSVDVATADDLARLPADPDGGLQATPVGGDALVVGWPGSVCDLAGELTIGADLATLRYEEGLRPTCDAVAIGRGVVLRFTTPVDPAGIRTEMVTQDPVGSIARMDAERIALAFWGPTARVTSVRFDRGEVLHPRLQPPDRVVWAIDVDSGETPASCPSPAPWVDAFTLPPCRAAPGAIVYVDAATGAYLGSQY